MLVDEEEGDERSSIGSSIGGAEGKHCPVQSGAEAGRMS